MSSQKQRESMRRHTTAERDTPGPEEKGHSKVDEEAVNVTHTNPTYYQCDATFSASRNHIYLSIGRTSKPLTITIGHGATIAAIINSTWTPLAGKILEDCPGDSIPETPLPESGRHQPHETHVEPACIHEWDPSTRKPITFEDWTDSDGDQHLTSPKEVTIGHTIECMKCGWKKEHHLPQIDLP